MPRWARRAFFWGLSTVGIFLALGWLVLWAPFFSDFRRSIAEDALSNAIGQQLVIETDVRVIVAPTSHVTVIGVTIPSEEIDGTNLAELKLLELDVDLFALLSGSLRIDNIRIDGIHVNLIKQEDGTTSWSEAPGGPNGNASPEQIAVHQEYGILAFLNNKSADVTSVVLSFQDRVSGFEYLFDLETLALEQAANGEAVSVSGQGTLNERLFLIDGYYPQGASSTTSVSMGDLALGFDGQRISEEQGGGFKGILTLDSGDIGDVLDILKLKRTIEGSGQLTARLVRQATRLGVEELRTVVNFQDGSEITLEGSADDLWASVDFDLTASGRLFPKGQPPSMATELKDLELTRFSANLVSKVGVVDVKQVLLETNLFETSFREIGPITIGQVRRTESGGLALESILAQVGPRDAPYATASGQILDLLQFQDIGFKGTLNGPANILLRELPSDIVEAFGGIVGSFEVSDATGELSLSKLEVHSENTELWTMRASAAVRSVSSVEGIDFQLDLKVPDGAAFLSTLQLDTVDVGEVAFSSAVEGKVGGLETRVSVSVGESRIDTVLNTAVDKKMRPTVRGTVHSEQLNIGDVANAFEAAVRVTSLGEKAGQGSATGMQKLEVQPLVLDDQVTASELKAEPQTLAVTKDSRVVQPLVVQSGPADGKASDLLDLVQIGRDLDLEIAVEIEKVVGQAGVSKLSSELISKDGKADFGPLDLSYGGGYFRIGAAIDFIKTPQLVRVFGATSGWDFGEILDEIGAGIKAHGKLKGQFDLTGNHASARRFVDSMYGSATISMVNGDIATSLLDLAGLGVFPWLFSKELRQGYTTIVCAVAPLRINAGKASSNAIVVETKSVQLVAAGTIDWGNDRISFRAEPRPVGRPLARSAWPFAVTGRLSNPDFKIGGKSNQKAEKDAPKTGQATGTRTPCKPDIRQAQ